MSESVAMIAVATRGSVVEAVSVVSVCSLQPRGYGHRHGADAQVQLSGHRWHKLPGLQDAEAAWLQAEPGWLLLLHMSN